MKQSEAHSVTSSIDWESGTMSTTKMTGDRTSGLFAGQPGMGQLDFLKLLTTQLQYQDPMAPMENTEFVAQLAQFSQLESTTSMQKSMEEMAKTFGQSMDLQTFNSQSTTNAAAVSLVGKEVRLRQNTFEHNRNAEPREFFAHLGERTSATLNIIDGDGEVVKTITLTGKDATNTVKFTWDGTDNRGQKVPSGRYNLVIEGMHADESLYTFVEDFVTGIRYTNQGTMIRVSGIELPIGDILEVKHPTGTNGGGGSTTVSDLSMGQALALVGFEAQVLRPGNITYEPSPRNTIDFQINLGSQSTATLIVRDTAGKEVDRVTVTAAQLDANGRLKPEFELDARNYNGSDKYTIEISSNNPDAFFFNGGTITGVVNRNGVPTMVLTTSDNRKIYADASQIMALNPAKSTTVIDDKDDDKTGGNAA